MTLSLAQFVAEFPDEGQLVEFKNGVSRRPLQEAIVAFSNADGGVIVVGVSDDGAVAGHSFDEGAKLTVHQVVESVESPGRYELHDLDVDGTSVGVIAVSPRQEGFAQTSRGQVLVRRGKHNVALKGDELAAFVMRRATNRFERTPTDLLFEVVDAEHLSTIQRAFGWSAEQGELVEVLAAHQLLDTSRGGPVLTVAGVLCLTRSPEEHLGKAYIEVFRYPDEKGDYDKRDLITGPVDLQVQQATDAVFSELGTELVVLGTQRHQLPRLPRVVLREAIANAVAHRQYESTGTGIRIEIRPDKVTVTSPGTLPEPVTVANMREAEAARNPSVIRVLRELGLAEDAGRGVDVMQDQMRADLLEPPTFIETDHAVVVHLPTRATIAAEERAWIREIERRGELQPADRLLLVHASRGKTLTNSDARELLDCDSTEARRAFSRLTDAGLLERSGRRGGTEYRLIPDLAPPAGLRLSKAEMADVIVTATREVGMVTNTTVRERLGVDRSTALSILSDLVDSGRLVRSGTKRGTHYVVPKGS